MNNTQKLGIVASASLEKGVDVRLDANVSVEDIVKHLFLSLDGRG
jgi:hypothetical protein